MSTLVSDIVRSGNSKDHIRRELERHLTGMTAALEVQTLTSILRQVLSEGDRRCTLGVVIWERLRHGEKWKACFESLEDLRSCFDGGDELETMVTNDAVQERLVRRADTTLRTYWACSFSSLFPSDLETGGSRYSKRFLEHMVTLASMTSKECGLEYLQRARQQRMQRHRSRNDPSFISVDFREAIQELRMPKTVPDSTARVEASHPPESREFDSRSRNDSSSCRCPHNFVQELLSSTPSSSAERKDRICRMLEQRSSELCHRPLRVVMGNTLGLCNNKNDEILRTRTEVYLKARLRGKENTLRKI